MTEKTIGFFMIDKPEGITSHDVITQIRRTTHLKRVGHTGTLDPFATGIVLVPIGSATRLTQFTHDLPKTYEAEITLGATSDTDDITGNITPVTSTQQPTREEIQSVIQKFIGQIEQLPPHYAAIKVKGKKLYEYAREGKEVERKFRPVTIHTLEILSYTYPSLIIRTTVSSGTYIRALARDIGIELKTGAYVSALRRKQIGKFMEKNSIKLSDISTKNWTSHLHNPKDLISHMPQITVDETSVAKLQQGREVGAPPEITFQPSQTVGILDKNQRLIGIGTYKSDTKTLSPRIIFTYEAA